MTGFFPHLDLADEILSVKSLSGAIPCWELGEETFYAEITYTDSCHTANDPNKCVEPVPNLIETKYIRNTYTDEDDENAEYNWITIDNSDQIQITGDIHNKTIKISAIPSAFLNDISMLLEYSE